MKRKLTIKYQRKLLSELKRRNEDEDEDE